MAAGKKEDGKEAETQLGAAQPTDDADFAIVKDGCVRTCVRTSMPPPRPPRREFTCIDNPHPN